jgi:hypothetical protein
MRLLLAWFWMSLIIASILWYAFLLFYVGIKGGKEIVSLGQNLSRRSENGDDPGSAEP